MSSVSLDSGTWYDRSLMFLNGVEFRRSCAVQSSVRTRRSGIKQNIKNYFLALRWFLSPSFLSFSIKTTDDKVQV